MPTCFSDGKVRWTAAKPMWSERAIQIPRLMREFFCPYVLYGQDSEPLYTSGNIYHLDGAQVEILL